MKILVSKAPNSLREYWDHPAFGTLVTPRSGGTIEPFVESGGVWACDNDAFCAWDEDRFRAMLVRYAHLADTCSWVSAPDVVGDAAATLELFHDWWQTIDSCGYPVALVGQDGMVPSDVPWDLVDAIFIGGSTEWKLGWDAHRLVEAAKAHGKLAHMGRVNSRRRLRYAKAIGCDSVDGTRYARFTDAHLPLDLEFAAHDSQVMM